MASKGGREMAHGTAGLAWLGPVPDMDPGYQRSACNALSGRDLNLGAGMAKGMDVPERHRQRRPTHLSG